MDNATFSTTTDSQMAKKGYNGLLGSFSAAAPFIVTGYSSKGGYDEDYEVVGPLTSSLNSESPICKSEICTITVILSIDLTS